MKPQFKAINEDTEMRSLDGGRTWQIPGPSDAREAMGAISIGDGTGDGTGEDFVFLGPAVEMAESLVEEARAMAVHAERERVMAALRCENCNGFGSIHSPIIGVTECSACNCTGIDPDVCLIDVFDPRSLHQ